MVQSTAVRNGLGLQNTWLDWDQPPFLRRTWTLSTSDAGILMSFVAVVLTLAVPRIFLTVQRVVEVIWVKSNSTTRRRNDKEQTGSNEDDSEPNEAHEATEAPPEPCANITTLNHDSSDSPQGDTGATGNNLDINTAQANSHPIVAITDSVASLVINTPSEGSRNLVVISEVVDEQDNENTRDSERASLLGSSTSRSQPNGFVKAFMRRESSPGTALELFTSAFNRHLTWGQIFLRLSTALLCITFFAAITIMAVYSAWIATQLPVLSKSKKCGIWALDTSVNFMSVFNYMQEKEAGDYANRCYNSPEGSDGCNIFVTKSFGFKEKSETACPFADGFCLEEHNSYTLSTGHISSKELGFNVPVGYTFNRTTTCSPIQRAGYIGYDEEFDLIEYNYGQIGGLTDGNETHVSILNELPWLGAGYHVESFCSQTGDGGWHPIPEFLPEDNPETTLLLVYSQRNYHKERREDPVFPAKGSRRIGSEFLYLNIDPIATTMACTDKTSICDATGQICWDASDRPLLIPDEQAEKEALLMLRIVLLRSNICHSTLYRGGAALNANSKLYVYQSEPLAAEQWKVEAKQLFATSLVRIQIDLRDNMRGAAANEPGFVDLLPDEWRGVCELYKSKTPGWMNISVWAFSSAIVGSFVVFILTYQVGHPDAEQEMKSDKLFIEVILSLLHKLGVIITRLPWQLSFLAGRLAERIGAWFNRPAEPHREDTEANRGENAV